jgi:hypothetical protein
MLTMTPALREAVDTVTPELNSTCPFLSKPFTFDTDSRTVSAALTDSSDSDAALWFLECYQQVSPHFNELPAAVELLGTSPGQAAPVHRRGDKSLIRSILVEQCCNDWLLLFPYVCALDWEVTPGYPQNGRCVPAACQG